MKPQALALLLGASLVPALGIGHCPAGDTRAFDSCGHLSYVDSATPDARVVSYARRTTGGLSGDFTWSVAELEVTACSTSLTLFEKRSGVKHDPIAFEPADAKALHDALVDAGALDAKSPPFRATGCLITMDGVGRSGNVTVYEPSALPGTAWSNSFRFGDCASNAQTSRVAALLDGWIDTHFDPSYTPPDVIPLPEDPQIILE